MMTSRIKAAFVAVAAAAALGISVTQALSADEAPAEAEPVGASCLSSTQLTTRMIVDGKTLFIEDMRGRGAVLEMAAPCSHMKDLDQIGFEFDGSSQICGRTDLKVTHSANSNAVPVKCIVKTFTPMSRDETRAYLAKLTEK